MTTSNVPSSIASSWRTIRFIVRHPLNARNRLGAVVRYLAWQAGSRIAPGAVVVPFVGSARLLVRRGMTGATGNIYTGLHEFAEMAFVLHALRPEDVFVDVGANVGSYTILAGAVVGARCVAFEPVPTTFASLVDNVRLNLLESRVWCENAAIGRVGGRVRFTTTFDAMNRVALDGEAGVVDVAVRALDDVPLPDATRIVKIDVEGWESEVVAGGRAVLSDPRTVALLVELNGSGARYGFDEEAVDRELCSWGFRPMTYEPLSRTLSNSSRPEAATGTFLYIRDPSLLRDRVQSAPRFEVPARGWL